MKKLLLVPALGISMLPFLGPQPATSPLARTASETYEIDPVHSTILFRIEHASASYFWGRFNEFTGGFVLDSENPSQSSITIEVRSESVDTNSESRDKHITSDDFFAAKVHPTISFQSAKVEETDDGFEVSGTLTFLGQEKEVTFPAELVGRNEVGGQLGTRAGLQAELTIKRTDFGNGTYVNEGMLGDEVLLLINIEGVLQG